MKSRSGFTLVELLIVIVVIGILAAITLVAYGGINDKANAAQANSSMEQNLKALAMYTIENGAYPTPTTPSTATIGCFDGTTGCSGTVSQTTSTALVNAIKQEAGALSANFYQSSAALVQYTSANGYYIKYNIPLSQTCPTSLANTTYMSTTPSGNIRACYMQLPSLN